MPLCPSCGNEVENPEQCPVCQAGRAPKATVRKLEKGRCGCPRCNEYLEEQDWDGVRTFVCPTCRGTFFLDRGLEDVLNKLRAAADPVDLSAVAREFKDRFTRKLPEAIRYKKCPVCHTVMTRRNYGTVSGVIVDFCGDHGTWVDEAQFADLADFICRGGDVLAERAGQVRARIQPRGDGKPSIMDHFFGGSRKE